jgi:hypothetical protein
MFGPFSWSVVRGRGYRSLTYSGRTGLACAAAVRPSVRRGRFLDIARFCFITFSGVYFPIKNKW